MPLTGREILENGIVQGGREDRIRDASYDLSIELIIRGGKKDLGGEWGRWEITPHEMFIMVSKETVRVPPGFVGYAMPKTGLCNRGILAFNTGIIDPGYQGRLSSTA